MCLGPSGSHRLPPGVVGGGPSHPPPVEHAPQGTQVRDPFSRESLTKCWKLGILAIVRGL